MKRYDALLTLSGGMDSTLALFKWWQENQGTKNRILVVHVDLHDRNGRMDFEARAVKKILNYFYQQGAESQIDFVSSYMYMGRTKAFVQDIEMIGFVQGVMLRGPYRVDRVFICASKYDKGTSGYDIRAKRRFEVIRALTEPREIKYEYPIEDLSREDVVRALPARLRALTHFCRTPRSNNTACGTCKTCLVTLPVLEQLALEKK